MPDCPVCGNYYAFGTLVCRECGEELEERVDQGCENCDGKITPGDFFCHHCGIILEPGEGEIQCEDHLKREAIGVCVVCGKPVCEDCAQKKGNSVFCKTAEHVKIHQKWTVVFSTKIEYEAEMIKTNLESAGFPSKVFSQLEYSSFASYGKHAVVKVMVQRTEADLARHALRELDLLDENGKLL
jgi:hypothetical protein